MCQPPQLIAATATSPIVRGSYIARNAYVGYNNATAWKDSIVGHGVAESG